MRIKAGISRQENERLECVPQVHGAVKDTARFVREILTVEINSCIDNPLVFSNDGENGRILMNGNFHGHPISLSSDYLSIALSTLGNISERRTFSLLNSPFNGGLPQALVEEAGVNSGLMMAQVTAASLASENKVLSHPASVDSIPTCADLEDYVSMAPIAARKLREILENIEKILAIELFCAAQALSWRLKQANKIKLGKGTKIALGLIRDKVPYLEQDRPPTFDVEVLVKLIQSGKIANLIEEELGQEIQI